VRVARRPVEDWHSAVASDAAGGSGRCTSGGVMPQGFPVSPRRDWIWLSRSCTCRGLVMYLSCTRRIPALVTPRITSPLAAAVSEVPGRLK